MVNLGDGECQRTIKKSSLNHNQEACFLTFDQFPSSPFLPTRLWVISAAPFLDQVGLSRDSLIMLNRYIALPYGERFNTISHSIGAVIAFVGSCLLLIMAATKNDTWRLLIFSVYGLSTVGLYVSSAFYHGTQGSWRELFRKFDHIGIYFKIAGNYTPYCLLVIPRPGGWMLFVAVWVLAFVGVAQELLIGSKTRQFSMLIYFIMSASVAVLLKQLFSALPLTGTLLVMTGFTSYAIGTYFFFNETRYKYGHQIWHVGVVVGSLLQYLCLLLYIA